MEVRALARRGFGGLMSKQLRKRMKLVVGLLVPLGGIVALQFGMHNIVIGCLGFSVGVAIRNLQNEWSDRFGG